MYMREKLVEETQVHRKALISYVYRLTGCFEEAKDIAQESILRLLTFEKEEILNPKAWMFKVATNLSRDFLKSARNTRESYIGPWLPEPYLENTADALDELEIDESLSIALLVIIQTLSIKERVSYILYHILEFKHKEIASLLDISVGNCRQLSSRANKKIQEKKSPSISNKKQYNELTATFLEAIKTGNLETLSSIFRKDIELHSDGGGKAIAARKIIYGDDIFIAKFLIKVVSLAFLNNRNDLDLKIIYFNGALGLILLDKGVIKTAYQFEIKENKISKIFSHRNPDKLKLFKY